MPLVSWVLRQIFSGLLCSPLCSQRNVLRGGDKLDGDLNPEIHYFSSNILSVKARVTSHESGLKIPCSEISGLVLCSKLQSMSVWISSTQFGSVYTLGDSTCIISALEKNSTSFNPFIDLEVR